MAASHFWNFSFSNLPLPTFPFFPASSLCLGMFHDPERLLPAIASLYNGSNPDPFFRSRNKQRVAASAVKVRQDQGPAPQQSAGTKTSCDETLYIQQAYLAPKRYFKIRQGTLNVNWYKFILLEKSELLGDIQFFLCVVACFSGCSSQLAARYHATSRTGFCPLRIHPLPHLTYSHRTHYHITSRQSFYSLHISLDISIPPFFSF